MLTERLINLILLFFSYAFIGWCIEVTLKFFQFHRFINRGFLTGPWLPIYGSGAALITIAVKGTAPLESSVGTTFVVSFLLCGLLEYLTSYILEKRFHARWWDYSQKPMNLHGRVWIGNLILFGLGGVVIVDLINPLLLRLSEHMSLPLREIIAVSLSAVFVADYVMSHFVLKLVKTSVELSEADDTEATPRPSAKRFVCFSATALSSTAALRKHIRRSFIKRSALPSAWRRSALRRRDCGRKRKSVSLRCGWR